MKYFKISRFGFLFFLCFVLFCFFFVFVFVVFKFVARDIYLNGKLSCIQNYVMYASHSYFATQVSGSEIS